MSRVNLAGNEAVVLFSVALTVALYWLALLLQHKWKWAHPLFFLSAAIIVLLLVTGIPYETYAQGGRIVEFFLGPATVALAVPLYKHAGMIRRQLPVIVSGVAVGSLSGMLSSGLLVWFLHGSKPLMLSMLPKSATTPVSMDIVRHFGGIPELGAVLTVLTGLLGSMVGPGLLRAVGLSGDFAVGTAIGTAAHGIGTARIIRDSQLQGGVSAFCMGLNAILTSLFAIPLYAFFS